MKDWHYIGWFLSGLSVPYFLSYLGTAYSFFAGGSFVLILCSLLLIALPAAGLFWLGHRHVYSPNAMKIKLLALQCSGAGVLILVGALLGIWVGAK